MTNYKRSAIPLSIFILLGNIAPAFAGAYSTNTYINGTETGHRTVEVDNYRHEVGSVDFVSGSLKLETNFPNAWGEIKFDGDLSGKLNVSTDGPDPFVVGSYYTESGWYGYTDITNVDISESVDYFNTIYTHTVESGGN